MSTPTRTIPALGRTTAPIGLGCMGMSWAYTSRADAYSVDGVDVIRAALDRGITLLDTSDAYAAGTNEELVGRAISGRRDEAIIATKGGLVGHVVDGRPTLERDGRPKHLREAVDASLRRLGVDVIDLYYLHRIDPQVPVEESWGTLAEAVRAGKVRAIGLSEVTTEQADTAHGIHPVAAIQSELSLWTRDALGVGTNSDGAAAGDLVGWCAAHEAIFVPFSPLGRGFLTGALDPGTLPDSDFRAHLPRFTGDAARTNLRLVETVREIAERHGATPAQVALAWVLARGPEVIPIPGTTRITRLDENLGATTLELGADDLSILDGLPAAAGSRY
ncbi:aldo/keto reductase [Pseudoclavibacter chungangensis]|uniref:Aldo/keto reductase n=1 Tax=Pseudoclavibacter chungangensis TaxID=587635 RepID=A0A7J5BND2_9MICO|nr:aldo/keto reductase [Pseudoclavibacter chungangensis]KAB1653627.1 aldo/keto reductase [Pseudoclavibacter chungangensis]NYJ68738.1 aryl-alcohol dehydrogenase-like predicted oxidoreductase [Pseudoclavibacter chungangensis]